MNIIKQHKSVKIIAGILAAIFLSAAFAPLITPHDPIHINLDDVKQPPSLKYPFGSDTKGRCVFSRVVYGARVSLLVGLTATACAFFFGVFFGSVAGYFGGLIDKIVTFLVDITLSVPGLLLAIAITVVFEPGIVTVLIALCTIGWASFARLARSSIISIKEKDFVVSAIAIGSSRRRVLIRHLIPNIIPLMLVAATLRIGGFILGEASLSFLGLGVRPPQPTWGGMISSSVNYIQSAPWIAIFPGVAIAITILCFNLLGDIVRDYCDPKMK